MDMGDHVIVINASQAVFKGSKAEQKVYRHHTLYPGGLREISVKEQFARHPERVIELAVKGMLPKNKLGKAMAKKLKVYADDEGLRRHTAQRPQPFDITTARRRDQA
jgi:large subunit ribosomal protein L13